MYLHFSNSLWLLLLPFRLVAWHSLASTKLVAESSPPLCYSLLLYSLHFEWHWLITQWHTQHWHRHSRKMFPFPPARERRACAAAGSRERQRERSSWTALHALWQKQRAYRAAQQHCRDGCSAVCTKRNGNWNTHQLHCYSLVWCSLWQHCLSRLHLLLVVKSTRAHSHTHTHTHTRGLSLPLPRCGLQFTRWCE